METKMEANHKKIMAKIRTITAAIQAETKAIHERNMAKLNTHQERMMAHQEETETHTCGEETKTEPDPIMMLSAEKHHKIPDGEVAVTPVRGLRKQRRILNLAVEHRQKEQERIRENCGSWKKFAANRRAMIRHAGVTRHRGCIVGKN
jgi:hypothetical protein